MNDDARVTVSERVIREQKTGKRTYYSARHEEELRLSATIRRNEDGRPDESRDDEIV